MKFQVHAVASWVWQHWNPAECTIEKNTSGSYTIVDHSIQTSIASGTYEECEGFLRGR